MYARDGKEKVVGSRWKEGRKGMKRKKSKERNGTEKKETKG